jgi:hypothetical protein
MLQTGRVTGLIWLVRSKPRLMGVSELALAVASEHEKMMK